MSARIQLPSFIKAALGFAVVALAMAPAARAAEPLSVTELVSQRDARDGKEVTVEGMVTWVCPHRGCKATIVNSDGESKTSLVISQGNGMDKFVAELNGETLRVTGVFHERRVTAADLDAQEAAIKNPGASGHGHDDDCDDCPDKKAIAADPEKAAQAKEQALAAIAKQRQMLAKSSKGYLSFVSLEGKTWTKVD